MKEQTIGSRIKTYRTMRGMTQGHIADKLGMTEANFSSYERDKSVPPIKVLNAIAEILKVTPEFLMTGRIPSESNIIEVHPKTQEIIDSLARANGTLDEADYDIIADQVKRLIEYAAKKKTNS